jgi:hypothetical protein
MRVCSTGGASGAALTMSDAPSGVPTMTGGAREAGASATGRGAVGGGPASSLGGDLGSLRWPRCRGEGGGPLELWGPVLLPSPAAAAAAPQAGAAGWVGTALQGWAVAGAGCGAGCFGADALDAMEAHEGPVAGLAAARGVGAAGWLFS